MKLLRRSAYVLLLAAAGAWGMRPAPGARAPEPPRAATARLDPGSTVEPAVCRESSPPPAASTRREPPDAAPAATEPIRTARVADSIGPLRDALRPPQRPAVEAAVDRKAAAIAALQGEALADGADPADISARARRVQDEFEAELASVLDGNQMQAYYELKQQGGVGTYAIVMPGGRARRP